MGRDKKKAVSEAGQRAIISRKQLADFCNCSLFDPALDEIFENNRLANEFMHASGAWWSSDYNIKAAFDMDLQLWLLRVIDQKLTGEHNAAVWRRRNPKAEAAIPPPFNVKSGETYANTIIPERLRKLLGISKKETVEAAQKDAVQQLRELMMHGRKMRGEA